MQGDCHAPLRIVSWNIGLKALRNTLKDVAGGSLARLLVLLQADILCFQETKISNFAELTETIAYAPGYTSFFHCNRKHEAYAGVATIVRDGIPVEKVCEGITGHLQYKQSVSTTPATSLAAATPLEPADNASISANCMVASPIDSSAGHALEYATRQNSLPRTLTTDCESSHQRTGFEPLVSPIALTTDSSAISIAALVLDSEGRCLITDHKHFVLINCYIPALTSDDAFRYDYKLAFHEAIRQRIVALQRQGRRVILVGDLNVTHRAIDHCDPDVHVKERQLRSFEATAMRRWMNTLTMDPTYADWPRSVPTCHTDEPERNHVIDAFRKYFPTRVGAFTCWSIVTSARTTNYGTRLDYTLVDAALCGDDTVQLKHADIMQDFMGSDHCPVYAEFTAPSSWGKLVDNRDGRLSTAKAAVSPEAFAQSINALEAFARTQKSVKSFFSAHTSSQAVEIPMPAVSNDIASTKRKPAVVQMKLFSHFTKQTVVTNDVVRAVSSEDDKQASSDCCIELLDSDNNLSQPNNSETITPEAVSTTPDVTSPAPPPSRQSASAWAKLLSGKLAPPPCRCGIASVERTVKEGKNTGKIFFVCTKPAGKAGDTNARCDFFMWLDAWRELQTGKSVAEVNVKRPRDATADSAPNPQSLKRSRHSAT